MGNAHKLNLPKGLFEDEGDESFSDGESPSQEMQALIDKKSKQLDNRAKRKKRKTIAASTFDRARQELEVMIKKDEWSKCEARHLVALYERLHIWCYKVEDASLDAQARYKAVLMASSFVNREFDGDYPRAITYLRWAWNREHGIEKWRRENRRTEGGQLTWYALFSNGLLTKYKLFLARQRG